MRGDGHTASFGNNSPCIDAAVRAYLEERTLPKRHTVCSQDVPFAEQPLTAAGWLPLAQKARANALIRALRFAEASRATRPRTPARSTSAEHTVARYCAATREWRSRRWPTRRWTCT